MKWNFCTKRSLEAIRVFLSISGDVRQFGNDTRLYLLYRAGYLIDKSVDYKSGNWQGLRIYVSGWSAIIICALLNF